MTDRVAIVTGGRRGIGSAIASGLAQGGFHVAIVDLEQDSDAAATMAAIEAAGRQARFIAADIADLETHETILDQAAGLPGMLSTLVNNAGVSSLVRGDMLDLSIESFDRALGVNLRAAFFLTQRFARRLTTDVTAAEAAPFRSVINITSVNAADVLAPSRADYCMSKAALSMMSRLYAARLAEAGINVYEIRPGIMRTDMTAPSAERYDAFVASGGVPIARWGRPDDVGEAAAMLANGGLGFTTGSAIEVDGGLHLHQV
jgi:NAD(P)-dependent dehydrogenase (short-subunit alcohol dehydrogenase family)